MAECSDACDDVLGFPYSKLITRTLYLQVFDYDRFSRDDPIGEVCLPLAEVDLSTVQTMWKTLQPCKGHVVSVLLPVVVCHCRWPVQKVVTRRNYLITLFTTVNLWRELPVLAYGWTYCVCLHLRTIIIHRHITKINNCYLTLTT